MPRASCTPPEESLIQCEVREWTDGPGTLKVSRPNPFVYASSKNPVHELQVCFAQQKLSMTFFGSFIIGSIGRKISFLFEFSTAAKVIMMRCSPDNPSGGLSFITMVEGENL